MVITFSRRNDETRLMLADLRRWWSRPDRLKSLCVVYLVPLVIFAVYAITFEMVSIWVNLAIFAVWWPTTIYARRTWRRERRSTGSLGNTPGRVVGVALLGFSFAQWVGLFRAVARGYRGWNRRG